MSAAVNLAWQCMRIGAVPLERMSQMTAPPGLIEEVGCATSENKCTPSIRDSPLRGFGTHEDEVVEHRRRYNYVDRGA